MLIYFYFLLDQQDQLDQQDYFLEGFLV